jgi:hypothetical protein
MSPTNFLPSKIFQVKEKPSFWIIKRVTCDQRWNVFHTLTSQAFSKCMVSLILVYIVFQTEYCLLRFEDVCRFPIERVKRNEILFGCLASAFLASIQLPHFTKANADHLYISLSALLCALRFAKDRASIQNHKIVITHNYVSLHIALLFFLNYKRSCLSISNGFGDDGFLTCRCLKL